MESLFHAFLLASTVASGAVLGFPQNLCLPCHMASLRCLPRGISLCVCLSPCLFFFSYKDTSHLRWRSRSTPVWPYLNLHLITLSKTLFQTRLRSQVPGVKASASLWGIRPSHNSLVQVAPPRWASVPVSCKMRVISPTSLRSGGDSLRQCLCLGLSKASPMTCLPVHP